MAESADIFGQYNEEYNAKSDSKSIDWESAHCMAFLNALSSEKINDGKLK